MAIMECTRRPDTQACVLAAELSTHQRVMLSPKTHTPLNRNVFVQQFTVLAHVHTHHTQQQSKPTNVHFVHTKIQINHMNQLSATIKSLCKLIQQLIQHQHTDIQLNLIIGPRTLDKTHLSISHMFV